MYDIAGKSRFTSRYLSLGKEVLALTNKHKRRYHMSAYKCYDESTEKM